MCNGPWVHSANQTYNFYYYADNSGVVVGVADNYYHANKIVWFNSRKSFEFTEKNINVEYKSDSVDVKLNSEYFDLSLLKFDSYDNMLDNLYYCILDESQIVKFINDVSDKKTTNLAYTLSNAIKYQSKV